MTKKPFVLMAVCIAATVVLLAWGFAPGKPSADAAGPSLALIIESDTGAFLMQLRKGMSEAADALGARLSIISLPEEQPQADALFLLVSDPESWVRANNPTVPVVAIGEAADSCLSVTMNDEAALGTLLRLAAEKSGGRPVLLVTDEGDARSRARSRQAMARADSANTRAVPYSDDLLWPEECGAAVGLSARATVALAALNPGGSHAVLGFDPGDSRVSLLESGAADTLVLDKPYAMGYVAVQAAWQALHGQSPGSPAVESLLANADNMYLPENVKQVFPLLQ